MNGGVHGGGEEEEEEEESHEIGGEVFEASQFTTRYSKRKKGYTQLEDEMLIRAWEAVSLDAIHGTDQTGKRYWQRIEDKFFRLMPNNVDKTPHTYRSLQGRWDVTSPCWMIRMMMKKRGTRVGRMAPTKAKDNMRKDSEASSLREKIDHMVKSNELMVTMTIEAKKS
uniref:Myb-like domain-containing protein n=1 Tax=Hordeum vulgare subsp. vulgare TaxID=112509 RepID=A0A8I6ZDZ6_HORVV